MEELQFKQYITAILTASREKSVPQLSKLSDSFIGELTLYQQLEAAEKVREVVSPQLLLDTFSYISDHGSVMNQGNPILRKLIRPILATSTEHIVGYLATIKEGDENSISFVLECINESTDPKLAPILVHYISSCETEDSVDKTITILTSQESTTATKAISSYIHNTTRHYQIATLNTLGKIGNSVAVDVITQTLGHDTALDILLINQLQSIDTEYSIDAIIKALALKNARIRSYVALKVKQFGSRAIPLMTTHLEDENENVVIALLSILKDIHDKSVLKTIRNLIQAKKGNTNIRVAAYEAAAIIDPDGTAPMLIDALNDDIDDVAFAVAAILEDNLDTNILEGIHNIINTGLYPLERFAEIFIFTGCRNIITSIVDVDSIRHAIIGVCKRSGMEQYRLEYTPILPELAPLPTTSRSKQKEGFIWAIDDSRMILKRFDNFGVDYGIPIKTFESAKEALEELDSNTPSLIFVDLNMPVMSGTEFTKEIREAYPIEDLPIVLVTTQTDAHEDSEVQKGLFNTIIQKPFTIDDLITTTNNLLQE